MTDRAPHSEVSYLSAFKRVRNRVRKFYALEIILIALSRLHSPRQGTIEVMRQQPPWFLLLLIKWTILYGDFTRDRLGRMNDVEFDKLLNLMHDVDATIRRPSEYASAVMFLRGMAYQQLWHQEITTRSEIGRQSILFRHLDTSHRFRSWFIEETGINIDQCIDLSFMLLSAFLADDKQHAVTGSFFDPVTTTYSSSQISLFLRSISKSPSDIRRYLQKLDEKRKRDSAEFRERSPLLRFPLIQLDAEHYYYSIPLLVKSLGNFVYDILKSRDPQKFMDAFGPMFERYVEMAMNYLGEPYLNETAIKRLAANSKTVDFAILGDRANILIDAKAVEMTHGGMTSHRPEVITGQSKSSILKGIQQGAATAQLLSRTDRQRWSRERNFLVIITFKDLYLGTGVDFFKYVVSERVSSVLNAPAEQSSIPIEHMYFMSIDEFDYLAASLKGNNVRLETFLHEISMADQAQETKCLLVVQHLLRRWPRLPVPEYIENEFNAMFDRAARALGVNSPT